MAARIEVCMLAKPFAHWAYTLSYNIVSFLLYVTHTRILPPSVYVRMCTYVCVCVCVLVWLYVTKRVKCVLWFYMNFLESFMHSARKFVRQEFYHNNSNINNNNNKKSSNNNKKEPQISFTTCVGCKASRLLSLGLLSC